MTKAIIFIILAVILISQYILLRSAKKNIKAMDDVEFNLSVASYTPRIKSGYNGVRLTNLGAEHESTLLTIQRFNPLITELVLDQMVLENVSVYTAEDLVYELQYIGADGEITERPKPQIL